MIQAAANPTVSLRTHQLKTMKTLGCILGGLYLSWLPVLLSITTANVDMTAKKHIKQFVNNIIVTFIYSGSFVNPIIYHWSCPKFRKAIRFILRPKSSREYYRNLDLQNMYGAQTQPHTLPMVNTGSN